MVPKNIESYWNRWAQRLRYRLLHPVTGREPPFGWESVLDAVEDWICIIDPEGRITRSNSDCLNLFGIPAEDAVGKTCCSLLHQTPSPLPGCPLLRMMASGKRESEEMEVETGRWMLITVDPIFSAGGDILGAVHISRDITRRILIQNEREILVADLKKALNQIRTLSGLLPICASCKKIRDDKGYWNLLENYIETHSQASFSHGLCPECMEDIYGKEAWYLDMKQGRKNTGS